MKTTLDPNRKLPLSKLKLLTIASGSHGRRGNKLCVMEAVAWIAGEPHSDQPKCVSPLIGKFLRRWNDSLPDDESRKRLLAPLAAKVINTATGKAHEQRRAWMACDWLIRTFIPAWLRMAKHDAEAIAIETLPEIVDLDSLLKATPLISLAQRVASEPESAAWWAAESAAWWAAESAACSAACSAAWSVTRSVAESAACSAAELAAWSVTRSAAESALKQTTKELQQSAVKLVERMIDVSKAA